MLCCVAAAAAGPVDATVRVQEKRTWLYVPAAAHRSVLGCKLQRARAGRPTGTAAMDNARKVNLLEVSYMLRVAA